MTAGQAVKIVSVPPKLAPMGYCILQHRHHGCYPFMGGSRPERSKFVSELPYSRTPAPPTKRGWRARLELPCFTLVLMRKRGIYVLNKGARSTARSCDRSRYCISPSSKRRLLLEEHDNRRTVDIAISTDSKMLEP